MGSFLLRFYRQELQSPMHVDFYDLSGNCIQMLNAMVLLFKIKIFCIKISFNFVRIWDKKISGSFDLCSIIVTLNSRYKSKKLIN